MTREHGTHYQKEDWQSQEQDTGRKALVIRLVIQTRTYVETSSKMWKMQKIFSSWIAEWLLEMVSDCGIV